MIDLHSHVLPGVDDGPDDLEAAVAMCRAAATDGCTAVVTTPHLRHPAWPSTDRDQIRSAYERVRREVEGWFDLRLGAEIRVDADLLGELGGDHPSFLSLAGSRYLLLELDRWGTGPSPEEIVHEARVAGWIPVLAHPEHIPLFVESPDRAEILVRDGAMLQVTAMSVTGEFGRAAHRTAWELLDRGLVHFVASDSHSPEWRPPGLEEARRLRASRLGEEAAWRLTRDLPARVLADRPPDEEPVGAGETFEEAESA
ncbi:MAG: CpsB/CapC family capsule biosynthesis tyrosine phosphatase [Thermoanaerobaculia bacterium]|nr:CpsB/CapC family capsule biosynthesis tyrosine phosphatase [Thermoanaerobaculia bacterium]